jgi:membrane protease YdiL (CAAX protease family)
MTPKIDTKRILIFLAFVFGIAWATGLVIYLTGGLANSPRLASNLPLALVLMATFYLWAPALANIFTRLLTREGWANTLLRPNFRHGWPYWLAAWVLPGFLVIWGGTVYYMLFPQYYDQTLSKVAPSLPAGSMMGLAPLWPIVVWLIAILRTVVDILVAPPLNAIVTFGEEFGWRAYLLPKLLPLGSRKAVVLMGVIWGVWHWPVIFMGYEYGFDYPGWPWLGPLLFIWFTFTAGVFLAWVTLRGGSVWPAVIGHAAINGIAQLPIIFLKGTPNLTVGPIAIGVVGGIGFTLLAVLLLALPGRLEPWRAEAAYPPEPAPVPVGDQPA